MIGWLTWRIGVFVLSGALALGAGVALYNDISLRAEIRTLKGVLQKTDEQLKDAHERLGTCQANYRGIELALDRQGKDIQALSDSSKAAGARAAEAARLAAVQSKAAQEASQRVLALPRPAPDQACEAAAKLLRGTM